MTGSKTGWPPQTARDYSTPPCKGRPFQKLNRHARLPLENIVKSGRPKQSSPQEWQPRGITITPGSATASGKNKPRSQLFKPCRWTLRAQSRYYSRPSKHP